LIVWGTADFAFGDSERSRFEQIFPNHVSLLFDKASHFLQEDEGERIAEAIRTFCGGNPIAR
jgi:haloalkane dehalogenase